MSNEVQRVASAWTDPGPRPDIHRQAQEFLRDRWPVLAMALDALAQADRREPSKPTLSQQD